MDVMEPLSTRDMFQGLSNNTLLDSGFQDEENKDSLFDLLSQSFPDMILQPYGHLSSLPLDVPDLQLSIQEDFCLQEEGADSGDDSILQEFVSEVRNIFSDTKRSNVSNAPDLISSLSSVTSLLPKPEDHFSPVKKLCPDQIDLLMGPLLDDDDEDYTSPILQSTPLKLGKSFEAAVAEPKKQEKLNSEKLAVACVKPIVKTVVKPFGNTAGKISLCKSSIADTPTTRVIKVEEESSDEVDIETVDDDELNGRSGAEVLFAQLANENCQAARVRALPPRIQPAPSLQLPQLNTDICHRTECDESLPVNSSTPAVPSFPPMVKPSPKPKEKEQSPSLVVEKIKQSAIAPRSSILIPHQDQPQSRGKSVKQEKIAKPPSSNDLSTTCASPYDARTFDHDYCNMNIVEQAVAPSVFSVNLEPTNDLCVASNLEVPTTDSEVSLETTQKQSKLKTVSNVSCDIPVHTSKPAQKVPVVKSERELPLSYRKWHHSRSPSPYTQTRCKKRGSRRRSSCSPSSVSSHSIYRSRSRSLSRGRKGRSQTYHRRQHSKGRQNHPHSMKRSRYVYSRSSSRSSFSSRSSSSSSSRSRSRTSFRSHSRSRSRSRSWDYNRIYNRPSVKKYTWTQEKRHYNDGKSQQIEERRVVYVGRLPEGTTKNDLRLRFGCFGPIQEVSVHFRDTGHNYGFVTFSYKRDAYEAVEHGNDDPNLPKFDLSFGGRRQFCQQRYSDLDSQYNYPVQRPAPPPNDFDALLRAAKLKMKKY